MNQWPLQKDCRKFYGAPGTNHTRIVPAYLLYYDGQPLKKGFIINKKCAESALKCFEKIAEIYSAREIKTLGLNNFSGCYNNRPMRGGTQLSMHAFACAIDFDAPRNQLKWNKSQARLGRDDCIPFWKVWESEGWVSLGRARDFDWMHVQAARL
jgi:hypothetical protein